MASQLADLVRQDARFHLILHPESCNVCFYYLPPSLRAEFASSPSVGVGAKLQGLLGDESAQHEKGAGDGDEEGRGGERRGGAEGGEESLESARVRVEKVFAVLHKVSRVGFRLQGLGFRA